LSGVFIGYYSPDTLSNWRPTNKTHLSVHLRKTTVIYAIKEDKLILRPT